MPILNAHDVVRFAIRIEENGEAFYRREAAKTSDPLVRDLFSHLATEEIGHRKTFETLLGSLREYRPPETYEGEYVGYLRDYIDGKVVFPKADGAAGGEDVSSALSEAIQREMDSIVYYTETKRFLADKDQKVVDTIIEEERKHFSRLSKMKNNPGGRALA